MRTINAEEIIKLKNVDLKRVHHINQIITRDCGFDGFYMYNEFVPEGQELDLVEWRAVAHYERTHNNNE